jgi:tRNA(Ile)-lysidine synthase TilS/MesJ
MTKFCSSCVLPETFPAIRFDENGICQYCLVHKHSNQSELLRKKYLDKFCEILNRHKKQGAYDVILAYSGGKDSSYTLMLLRQVFNLKILALTFDHGLLSSRALGNIHAVTRVLGVDHMMVAPSEKMLYHAFSESISSTPHSMKALQRASSICNTCMSLVKALVLKTAIDMGIPLITYGWSPGQIPVQASVAKLNASMIEKTQKVLVNSLAGVMADGLKPFLLEERHFRLLDSRETATTSLGYYNIHPLAFWAYDERKIKEEIRDLGWTDPEDTDANSTNCLLNCYATQVHLEKYGFHPYAFEIANLVREGFMSRETGLTKLSTPADKSIVEYVKNKLEARGHKE